MGSVLRVHQLFLSFEMLHIQFTDNLYEDMIFLFHTQADKNDRIPVEVCRALDFILYHHLQTPGGLPDLFKYEASDVEALLKAVRSIKGGGRIVNHRNTVLIADSIEKCLADNLPLVRP